MTEFCVTFTTPCGCNWEHALPADSGEVATSTATQSFMEQLSDMSVDRV